MKIAFISVFVPLTFLAAALPAPVPGGSSEVKHHNTNGNPWHGRSLSSTDSVTHALNGARDLHATEVEGDGVHDPNTGVTPKVHPTED